MLTFEQKRQYILERFDWDAVIKTMAALDWKWLGKTPTLEELKSQADRLLWLVHEHVEARPAEGWYAVATGGFEAFARRIGNTVRYELSFKATWKENQWEDVDG